MTAASGWEYLRTLAVSRLFLDNVRNIQASWVTQGAKIGQVALAFGANDMGSTMIEENVVAAAGTRFMLARDELVRLDPRRRATRPCSATRSTERCGGSSPDDTEECSCLSGGPRPRGAAESCSSRRSSPW